MPAAKKTTRATTRKAPAKKTTRASAAKKSTKRASTGAPTKKLSPQHKAALATGRTEAQHVRAYLDALAAHKPRRGRQRTTESVQKQLTQVQSQLRNATGFQKLELAVRAMELQAELKTKQGGGNLGDLRKNFVKHAAKYAHRKGVSKQAFRDAGVPPADIRDAGIR